MLHRSRAFCISVLLALLGCSGSNNGDTGKTNQAPIQGGAGGSKMSGTSGSGGAVIQAPVGGLTGGGAAPIFGLGGSGGTSSSSLGGTGPLGLAGAGAGGTGQTGLAGSNSGGSNGAGAAGANSRGPAPTFTTIYNVIITPNCGGAQCHLKRPTPFGYDFSSKSAASASWRGDVVAGDADNSPMFQVLNLAIMPKDKAPLSVEQLFMIYDWINAGALDN